MQRTFANQSVPTGNAVQNYRFIRPVQLTMWEPDFRNAVAQQWNLNVQQELFGSYIVTAAYVGSKGNHLFNSFEINLARPGTGTVNARRIYALDFGSIINQAAVSNSLYHSMQLSVNKRLTNNFTLLASHTWSKLIDDASSDGSQPANPYNLRAERGRSDLDVAHRFVASFVYDLPRFAGAHPLLRYFIGGWQSNGIISLQSGRVFSAVSGRDNSQSGVKLDRANLIGDPKLATNRTRQELIDRYFNSAAFAQNPTGTFGTAGSTQLQFRTEFFNLFNRVNLSNPNNNLSSAQFGRITTSGDPRVIQFALKYVF